MAEARQLKRILSPVLRLMRIDETQLEEAQSYTLDIGESLSIQFEENPDNYLTVSCLLPMQEADLNNPKRLALLLQCNVLGLEHPPVITGTLLEQKKLILWTRLAFNELEAPAMTRLFERFVELAGWMSDWMQSPQEEEIAV